MKRFFVVGIAVSAIGIASAAAPPTARPAADDAIVHVLNRVGFGPRPGDVERVRATGVQRYIDEQLRPERIVDDQIDARLADLTTVRMTLEEIAEQIERPVFEARRDRRAPPGGQAAAPLRPDPTRQKANSLVVELSEQKLLRAIYSERQLQEVLVDFWFNHFNVDARKGRTRFFLTSYERDTIRPHILGKFRDLLEATAKSPAMLFYLDNFMSADPNGPHFGDRPRIGARGFAAGQRSDNARQPGAEPATNAIAAQQRRRGLNENYARELMELHTLGVDGGYTQRDVVDVARAFTGWTIANPRQGVGYRFETRLHDPGEKIVLGHKIAAGGGESDGEQVLDQLSRHPSTARFIATKLAQRFVSDTPPAALVDRAAKRFRDTDGDLREVTRTILTSREFLTTDAYRAKLKNPFEFVVSAVRASGVAIEDPRRLVRELQQMGMPLYMCQPPTGYKDTADAWANAGALVGRMNFALQLAQSDRELAQMLGAPEFQRR